MSNKKNWHLPIYTPVQNITISHFNTHSFQWKMPFVNESVIQLQSPDRYEVRCPQSRSNALLVLAVSSVAEPLRSNLGRFPHRMSFLRTRTFHVSWDNLNMLTLPYIFEYLLCQSFVSDKLHKSHVLTLQGK